MAQRAVIQIEVESGDARAELEQVEQGLEEVDIAAVEAGDGFERMSNAVVQEAAESRAEIQSMASATQRMGSASSTANNLTFELTNQLQDMQAAGIQGATNAIPMISEQFLRLKNQAGSTTGALSKMLSTFTGPTGILAIGTLGLQALPSVIDFFSGVREEAGKTAEEVKNLKEATDQLITGFESELPDFQIADAGQARQSVEALEQSIQSREQLIEDLEEALGAAGAEQAQLSRGAARFADLADQTIQKLIRRNERVIEQERGLRRAIQERLDRREDEVGQAELLKNVQGVVVDQAEDITDEQEERAEKNEDAAEARREELQALRDIKRVQAAISGTTQQDRVRAVLADPRRDLRANLRQNIQDAQLVGSARELGRAPQGSGAKGPGATGTPGLEAISMSLSEIQEEFDVSKRKAKQFKREAERQVGQIISAVGSLGEALVRVFEDGETSATEFASAALTAIGSVISAIPGAGQVAGPLFSAAGRIVGSFEHGGEPEPGLAKVHPPELMMMNGEERIIGREETKAILRGASGGAGSEVLAQKIQENTRAIKNLQLTADSSGIHLASQDFQSELERTGARMYPAP
jgi:hypothetical protein